MKRLFLLLTLLPTMAQAGDYIAIDDKASYNQLSQILGCHGASNAVTYDDTTHTFGCNSIGGGPGGTNTASNLGGGLANYDSVSGTDLRFNSFSIADFDLASHLLTIDDSKWATDAQVATAVSDNDERTTVVDATADLAGNAANLEGVDIIAAIALCGANRCRVNLQPGTYANICIKITRSHTYIVGKGSALNPYLDLDDCTVTDHKEMIQIDGADDVELAHIELDGKKEFLSYTNSTCGISFCGSAIRLSSSDKAVSHNFRAHDLYIHDFAGQGIDMGEVQYPLIEHNTIARLGCHQTTTPCGCGAGDPGGCRGFDAAPDVVGYGIKVNGTAIAFSSGLTTNGVARFNAVDTVTKHGIETYSQTGSPCGPVGSCPSEIDIVQNEVSNAILGGIGVNGGQHVTIAHNLIHDSGAGQGLGDQGAGLFLTSSSVYDVVVESNDIYDNASGGMVIKPLAPGAVQIRGNRLQDNCQLYANPGNLLIWSASAVAAERARDIVVEDNDILGSSGCLLAMNSTSGGLASFGGSVRFYGGHYDSGSLGSVSIENEDVEVRGLSVDGNLKFTATAHGIAAALDVSGTITNTGGVCILTNTSTPIPSSCVAP